MNLDKSLKCSCGLHPYVIIEVGNAYLIGLLLGSNEIKYVKCLVQGLAYQFSSIQWLSRVRLFGSPWTAAHQASLSITNSQSLLKLMAIESVMPSNHLILCRPLLLPPCLWKASNRVSFLWLICIMSVTVCIFYKSPLVFTKVLSLY